MVQALAEERQVQTCLVDGRRFQIAQPVFQIPDAVFPRQLAPRTPPSSRNCPPRSRVRRAAPASWENVPSPAPRSAIDHRRHQLQQRLGKTLPRPSRHVVAAELARQFVEVAAHFVAPLFEHQLRAPLCPPRLPAFRRRRRAAVRRSWRSFRRYKLFFPCLPVFHQAGLLQLGEMRGNAALPRRQDLLQFRHRQALPAPAAAAAAAGWDRPARAAISGLTPSRS